MSPSCSRLSSACDIALSRSSVERRPSHAVAHRRAQSVGDRGHAVLNPLELAGEHRDELHRRHGDHRRRASAGHEQSDLAEHVALPQQGDHLAAPANLRFTLLDDEEPLGVVALRGKRRARHHIDVADARSDLGALFGVELGEQRQTFETCWLHAIPPLLVRVPHAIVSGSYPARVNRM